jgi:hypothetical protein
MNFRASIVHSNEKYILLALMRESIYKKKTLKLVKTKLNQNKYFSKSILFIKQLIFKT